MIALAIVGAFGLGVLAGLLLAAVDADEARRQQQTGRDRI